MTEVNVNSSVIIGGNNVCPNASVSGNWRGPNWWRHIRLLVMRRVTLNPCFLPLTQAGEAFNLLAVMRNEKSHAFQGEEEKKRSPFRFLPTLHIAETQRI